METTQERTGVGPEAHDTEERRGGCEGCVDVLEKDGQPPITRIYRGVRRDGEFELTTVRYCDECAGLVRFAGVHDDWDNLIILGDLVGRTITFRRPIDGSRDTGVVARDVPEHNAVIIAPSGKGRFGQVQRAIHRSNIISVEPVTAYVNTAARQWTTFDGPREVRYAS